MSLVRSLFKLLFLHIPKSLFQIAGIIRIVNRGKRAFRKALREKGLPEDVVDVLVEGGFFVEVDWNRDDF